MKRILVIFFLFILCYPSLQAQGLYRDRYTKALDEKYTTGLFRGDNAYFVVPMDDPGATGRLTIFHYLQGRVPGLQISGVETFKPVVKYRYSRPAFFLDEIRVDAGMLASINMNDIALVKVFRPPFMGAFGGGSGGAIAVYTKTGEEE